MKQCLKFLRSLLNHSRREFLAADFKKEIAAQLKVFPYGGLCLHLRASANSGALVTPTLCFNHNSATRTASLRTRPIIAARSVTEIAPRASSRVKRCEQRK